MKHRFLVPLVLAAALSPGAARAHCDTLDGPVVSAARAALQTGALEPVLAWVRAEDEREIRDAFSRARTVRKQGGEAAALADQWFFETVVRVHRAGEGAPFTGLRPAGTIEPAVAAADRAIASGNVEPVHELLAHALHEGLDAHWSRLHREKPPGKDVAAGRRWVAAYVPFVHWVEGVHVAATGAGGHGAAHDESAARPAPHDAARAHAH